MIRGRNIDCSYIVGPTLRKVLGESNKVISLAVIEEFNVKCKKRGIRRFLNLLKDFNVAKTLNHIADMAGDEGLEIGTGVLGLLTGRRYDADLEDDLTIKSMQKSYW